MFLYERYSCWDPLGVLVVLLAEHPDQAVLLEPDSAVEEIPDNAKEPDEGYRVRQEDLRGDRPDVPPEIGGVAGERVDAVCDEHVSLALVLLDLVVKVRACRVHRGRAEELPYDDAHNAGYDKAGRLLERREEEVLDAVLQDAEGPRDPPGDAVVYEE